MVENKFPKNSNSQRSASPITLTFAFQMISCSPHALEIHQSPSSPTVAPSLSEREVTSIAQAAARIASKLPNYEPKRMNLKKQVCREIEVSAS